MDELTLTPYAARLQWCFSAPRPLAEWRKLLAELLDELALATQSVESAVIGHIKALVLLPAGGYVRGSKVSAAVPADVEIAAAHQTDCAELELSLNVLVYGLPLPEMQRIVAGVVLALALCWEAEAQLHDVTSSGPHEHRHHHHLDHPEVE